MKIFSINCAPVKKSPSFGKIYLEGNVSRKEAEAFNKDNRYKELEQKYPDIDCIIYSYRDANYDTDDYVAFVSGHKKLRTKYARPYRRTKDNDFLTKYLVLEKYKKQYNEDAYFSDVKKGFEVHEELRSKVREKFLEAPDISLRKLQREIRLYYHENISKLFKVMEPMREVGDY